MRDIPFKVGAMIQPLNTLCLCTSHYVSTISSADGRICNKHHSLRKQISVNFNALYQMVDLLVFFESLL